MLTNAAGTNKHNIKRKKAQIEAGLQYLLQELVEMNETEIPHDSGPVAQH